MVEGSRPEGLAVVAQHLGRRDAMPPCELSDRVQVIAQDRRVDCVAHFRADTVEIPQFWGMPVDESLLFAAAQRVPPTLDVVLTHRR